MGSNRGLEACRAELQEFFLRLARLRGRKREARLHLDGHHVVEDALNQAGGRHIVLERPRHHRVPVRRGLQQPARDGPVHARLDAIQHVHDHVLRERVLRVVHLLTPHVAGIDPQTNLRLGPDVLGSADQVPLVVAAQLSRGHPRRAGPEHRLHKVLRAGGGGHVTPDQVRPFGVGDFFVLEQVLVHAAEEGLGALDVRAARVERGRDHQPRVAAVRVVLVGRREVRVVALEARHHVRKLRVSAGVDVHDQHVFDEHLQVGRVLRRVELEDQSHEAVLERLGLGRFEREGVGLGEESRRGLVLGADEQAGDHKRGQVNLALGFGAERDRVGGHKHHVDRQRRVLPFSVLKHDLKLDLDLLDRVQRGVQRDVDLRKLVVGHDHLRAALHDTELDVLLRSTLLAHDGQPV
mmetsp:Transcript_7799/g.12258  ORF Transcript_7799/g.12258 Transcript_7799/m.12258 type:complete len:408 (+) Transcript_7799:597-1820(+)